IVGLTTKVGGKGTVPWFAPLDSQSQYPARSRGNEWPELDRSLRLDWPSDGQPVWPDELMPGTLLYDRDASWTGPVMAGWLPPAGRWFEGSPLELLLAGVVSDKLKGIG